MKNKILDFLFQTLLLSIGSLLCSISINGIVMPNKFLAGGLTGISLIIYYVTPFLSVGIIYFLINIPVFFLGWRFIGLRFVLYTFWGMLIYSILLHFVHIKIPITDKLLSVIISGGLTGIGVAIMLRSRGSAGGSEILSVILFKLFNISLGTGVIIINSIVMFISLFLFPVENVMYTIIYIVISAKTTDMVFSGLAKRQTVFIISEYWESILKELTDKLGIGVTVLEGKGGYKWADKKILYSVIPRNKVYPLKKLIIEKDSNAFITIIEANDVTNVKVGNQPGW